MQRPKKSGLAWEHRWPKRGAVAEKRYNEFAKPLLPNLKKMATRISKGNKALAEDMLSLAIIKIVSGAGQFDYKRPMENYFMSIAKRAMLDVLKKEKKQQRIRLGLEQFLRGKPERARLEEVSELSISESISDIEAATNRLFDLTQIGKKRRAIFWFYLNPKGGDRQKSYTETAKRFKIPIGTVKSIIFYARRALKTGIASAKKH